MSCCSTQAKAEEGSCCESQREKQAEPSSCCSGPKNQDTGCCGSAPKETEAQELLLALEGLHCINCVGKVEKVLGAHPGVLSAKVNLTKKQARLKVDSSSFEVEPALAELQESGFTGRLLGSSANTELILGIEGLHCINCVGKVEKVLQAQPGVVSAKVKLTKSRPGWRFKTLVSS